MDATKKGKRNNLQLRRSGPARGGGGRAIPETLLRECPEEQDFLGSRVFPIAFFRPIQ